MEGKRLQEYLTIVLDMEKQIYMEKQLESELLDRKNRLCVETFIKKPTIKKVDDIKSGHRWVISCGVGLTLGDVVGWCCFFYVDFWWHGALGFLGVLGLMASVVLLIVGIISLASAWMESLSMDDTEMQSFRAWQEYEEAVKENQRRISQEKVQKIYLESEIKRVEEKLRDSQMRLQTLYSYGIVFPKYQNFVMISSIHEYICSGRCSTLEGHEGAYNILEMELRLDRIEGKLDNIIQKLNQIKDNQYTIYYAIQEAKNQCSALVENSVNIEKRLGELVTAGENTNATIDSLHKNSEIQKYISSQTQKELDYMNRMNYLAGNYKAAVYGPNF